ncbi:hypothetical protein Aperf_G00000126443 [Anoplocephala perfoliata]
MTTVEPLFDPQGVPNLPDNLLPYQYQVGGHGSVSKSRQFAMLRDPIEPIVFKQLPRDDRSIREANFYLTVFSKDAPPEIAQLQGAVPSFCGIFKNPSNGDLYLALEDLTAGLTNPSICDLKMGQECRPPDDSEEKIKAGKAKYPDRETVGFLLTGMKVYNQKSGGYLTVPRYYGRSLKAEEIFEKGLLPFLQGDIELAKQFIPLVKNVRSIFIDTPKLPIALYSSSLLLMYDQNRTKLNVKLVDFAHWRSNPEANDPSGVVHGFDNLIEHFDCWDAGFSSQFCAPFIGAK